MKIIKVQREKVQCFKSKPNKAISNNLMRWLKTKMRADRCAGNGEDLWLLIDCLERNDNVEALNVIKVASESAT